MPLTPVTEEKYGKLLARLAEEMDAEAKRARASNLARRKAEKRLEYAFLVVAVLVAFGSGVFVLVLCGIL